MDGQKEQSLASPRTLDLTNSISKLCMKLYSVLSPTGNQCLSPACLHQLLSVLVALCEQPTTKRNLIKLLEMPADTESDELNRAWNEYLTVSRNFNFALFSFQKLALTDELGLIVKNMYRGDVIHLEYGKNPRQEVNEWIERSTAGVIKKIDLDINPHYIKSLLVSALYFKAKWSKYLDWKILPDVTFHVDEQTSIKTNFMHEENFFDYAEDSKRQFQALKLTYENDDYFLIIILPENIHQLEQEMVASPDFLGSLKFECANMCVYLPEFVIRCELDIMKMLYQIKPDLEEFYTGSQHGLYVTDIKQVNQIDVNRYGTEAASITYTAQSDGIGLKAILLNANKPFVYMLCHKKTVLFTGRLCNPLEK